MSSAAPGARDVAGWPVAFRGSAAVRAGLVTPGQLRGPAYLRLFPDTYVRRAAEPPKLALRAYAAHLYSGRRGILSGYSAADRLGAECHPPEAPAELTVRRGDLRSRSGLLVHRDRLRHDEHEVDAGVPVTTALRSAYDLALAAVGRGGGGGRRAGPPRPVPPVGRVGGGRPVSGSARPCAAAPGGRAGRRAGRVADGDPAAAGAGAARAAGARGAVSSAGRAPSACGVAGPRVPGPPDRIEYEGEEHTRPERVRRDVGRCTGLVDQGWRIYRFTKYEVYGEPDEIVAKIRRALAAEMGAVVARTMIEQRPPSSRR